MREAGERAAVDVANVVDAGLQRTKIDAAELLPDFGDAVEREAAEFDLPARGDVEHIVAEAARKIGNGAKLRAAGESVGHADAHHEFSWRRPTEKDTDPFEQFLLGGRQSGDAAGDDSRQVIEYAQAVAVFGGFVALDGVEAWSGAGIGERLRGIREAGVTESRRFQAGLHNAAR